MWVEHVVDHRLTSVTHRQRARVKMIVPYGSWSLRSFDARTVTTERVLVLLLALNRSGCTPRLKLRYQQALSKRGRFE